MATFDLGSFRYSQEEKVRVFRMIQDSLAMPSGLGALLKSNNESSRYSPINTQKSSMSISDGWEEINQWIEGLYPSTINKVHHEWRL